MKIKIISLMMLCSFNSFAGITESLPGHYTCSGKEVDSHESFTCEMIIKKTGATFVSLASCSDGNSYRGTGIYDHKTHQLSTCFINPKKSEETGVAVSTFKSPSQFVNAWTYIDKTSIAYVSCSKNSKT